MSDVQMAALERRYAAWARGRSLEPDAAGHHFVGRVLAREVTFATGLGGSAPSAPELVVLVSLPVDVPVLLQRSSEQADEEPETLRVLREVLGVSEGIRNLGVTASFVRITFVVGAEDAVFDSALEAVEERLRTLTTADVGYRG